MLNEERIKLMTKMASYEAGEGKKNKAIGNYFRGDYLSMQVLKSIIYVTISFFIIFGLFLFYDFEIILQDIYKMDLIDLARKILTWYGITVVSYGGLSYGIYSYRYKKAKKSLKTYYNNLRKLSAHYE